VIISDFTTDGVIVTKHLSRYDHSPAAAIATTFLPHFWGKKLAAFRLLCL